VPGAMGRAARLARVVPVHMASHCGEGIADDGSPTHMSAMPEGYSLAVTSAVAAGTCRVMDLDFAFSLPGMQLSVPGVPDRACGAKACHRSP